jgi:hypothetical protein
MPAPPPRVVRAFGGDGVPQRLEGGQGTSWRCGDVVLKPADAAGDATRAWLHDVAEPRVTGELRIAFPLPAQDGALRVDGWEATPWLPGTRPAGRWLERADVVRRCALAFAAVDPGGLPPRHDPWAVADRAAWDEIAGPLAAHPLHRLLTARRRPLAIVHGDAAGNTLLHEALPPAMIDLSLYARPVEWALAVLAVDVVAFEGAPLDLLATIGDDPDFPELLARALLFRMTTDVLRGGDPDPAYERVVTAVLRSSA